MKSQFNKINNALLVMFALFCSSVSAADAPKKVTPNKDVSVFATVGKETISWQRFEAEYRSIAKNKFFHGKPADSVIAELQHTVADKLVDEALLVGEAKRRKLKPNSAAVNQEIKQYEQKVSSDANWEKSKARVLPMITKQIQNESLVKQLEDIVRNIPTPTGTQVQAYYNSNPDKFTSPIEQRVSVILLRVDPSSTTAEWKTAAEDAATLAKRIREGESFAELAKQYSKDDQTVDQGGDMGYLHDGMLPPGPQGAVNKLKIGETSEPVRLMEGMAIFQLTERNQPGLASFDSVKQRAKELLQAQQSDDAWKSLLAKLRKSTPMNIDESRFLPLSSASVIK